MNQRKSEIETAVLPLTDREREVLAYMADGFTNQEIAAEMVIAESTVKWYARQIFNKLAVENRREAARRARTLGLLYEPAAAEEGPPDLPPQLTSFVGRERELFEIKHLLKNTRLLTLTGAGGSGKTRLAIRVAAQSAHGYADGAAFVSLASTMQPEQVAKTIAQELEVQEHPNQSLDKSLQRYLASRNTLLILDNFEHVLAAAPLVSDLLGSAPRLTILVTSREALNLSGEHEYLVPPLALPDAPDVPVSDLMAVDSVDLFVQRARSVSHRFAITEENGADIARICMRLDGLPLAIELAAARVKLFGPQQILERLIDRLGLLVGGPRDMPQRQRTLRATIEWSYNLLSREEQRLFSQLAVFNGGRTVEAVETVCSCEGVDEPFFSLESLLNKNLLFVELGPGSEPRFCMLETIHEYARERLLGSGDEQTIRNRHLDYFLRLVEEMAPGFMSAGQLALFRQADAEMDNIRTAFEWAVNSGQIEKAARLITAVNYFLRYDTVHLVEGYRLNNRLLPYAEQISPQYRVPLLNGASELAFHNSDLDRFRMLAGQALDLARELGDKDLLAWSLAQSIDYSEDDEANAQAIAYGEEAIQLFRELGNKPGLAYTLLLLGEVHRLCGDLVQAKKAYEESMLFCRETGEVMREEMNKHNLCLIAYMDGDYVRAYEILMPIIRKKDFWRWKHAVAGAFAVLSAILSRLGDPEKAARILGACHRLNSELGLGYHAFEIPVINQGTADTRALMGEAAFEEAWAEGQCMTYEQLLDYVLEEEGKLETNN
ncbi:MAG: LuxR C-terminal-related transcriptional regulator [Candidatus Promineifilaceae bacterium]